MHALIGIAAVFVAILGGFLLEKGNLYVLFQPAELLIVGGAALGIVMVANPPGLIRKIWRGALEVFRPPARTPQSFLRNLRMLYEVFSFIQRAGIQEFERDVESPEDSRIFANHPEFLKDREARDFLCDSLRMLVVGMTTPADLDRLMDLDIEVQRHSRQEAVAALHAMADALPGLGIVAAVLGVVITMQAIGGAPELIGQKVAAALVGTFLGILLCYGVVGPIASRLEKLGETESQWLNVVRIAMVAFARGASPILAVEYARRSIPVDLRPGFVDMELTIKRDARIPPAPKLNLPMAPEASDAQTQPA
ncbi:MAG: flagellar motor stator protein MotA [Candidatus Solibacter sp.]